MKNQLTAHEIRYCIYILFILLGGGNMARKLNMKMKALFAMLMCGLSTFTVFHRLIIQKNKDKL